MRNGQIRGKAGQSSYFQGKFEYYGLYQYNVKYYNYENDYEQETVICYFLGEITKRGYEQIDELLGREIECFFAGRSGGWFVVNTELSEQELLKLDEFVQSAMKRLPEFLKEDKEFQEQQEIDEVLAWDKKRQELRNVKSKGDNLDKLRRQLAELQTMKQIIQCISKDFKTVQEYLKLVKTSSKKHLELVRQICEKRQEVERNIRNCQLHEQNCPTNYESVMNNLKRGNV